MMNVDERAAAIKRAKRAFKALADHPDSSQRHLGTARDRLNDCYRLSDSEAVWEAVRDTEAVAARIYGVPQGDEPVPRGATQWVSPRGGGGAAKPRRSRQIPRS